MWHHWINELINLLAGNSRYVHYPAGALWLVVLSLLMFLLTPFLLYWLT